MKLAGSVHQGSGNGQGQVGVQSGQNRVGAGEVCGEFGAMGATVLGPDDLSKVDPDGWVGTG